MAIDILSHAGYTKVDYIPVDDPLRVCPIEIPEFKVSKDGRIVRLAEMEEVEDGDFAKAVAAEGLTLPRTVSISGLRYLELPNNLVNLSRLTSTVQGSTLVTELQEKVTALIQNPVIVNVLKQRYVNPAEAFGIELSTGELYILI